MPRKDHIQISDAQLAAWLETQREPGESRGQCAGRLLREYRLILIDPEVGRTVRALRRLAARLESGEITTAP